MAILNHETEERSSAAAVIFALALVASNRASAWGPMTATVSGSALATGFETERAHQDRWLAPLAHKNTAEPCWFAPAELVVYGAELVVQTQVPTV